MPIRLISLFLFLPRLTFLIFCLSINFGLPTYSSTLISELSSLTFKAYQFKRLPTNGSFSDYDIDLVWPQHVNVTINIKSISTKNKTRDRHLKSKDFLHVDSYPISTFKSTSITPIPKQPQHYLIYGTLHLKATSKPISFPVSVSPSGNRLTFSGSTSINRFDYGITHYKRTVDKKVLLYFDFEFQN